MNKKTTPFHSTLTSLWPVSPLTGLEFDCTMRVELMRAQVLYSDTSKSSPSETRVCSTKIILFRASVFNSLPLTIRQIDCRALFKKFLDECFLVSVSFMVSYNSFLIAFNFK